MDDEIHDVDRSYLEVVGDHSREEVNHGHRREVHRTFLHGGQVEEDHGHV